jgi:rod shape-determining protein MreC
LQRAVAVPVEMASVGRTYLQGLVAARQAQLQAEQLAAGLAERATRAEHLAAENARLRALLALRPALTVRSLPAEVLYEAADPYSRKVFIDRGLTQGVKLGAPVIGEAGVLGQVTQVYPVTSEVTLLTDKDAAIPVLNTRTQQRSAAFGAGRTGGLELRFMSGNADVQVGDVLHTSGLDGVYPPGLPVAKVASVERRVESGFARIALEPVARADGMRQVLVLEPIGVQLPQRPEPVEPLAKGKPEKTPKPRPGMPSP